MIVLRIQIISSGIAIHSSENAKTLSSTNAGAAHCVTDYYEDGSAFLTSRYSGDTARVPHLYHSYWTKTEVQLAVLIRL